jgi:hypothetical protein
MNLKDDRYCLLYTVNKTSFETISLLDKKLKRIYCGSPIGSDSISLKEYGNAIKKDKMIPISKDKFLKIKKESFVQLRKDRYLDFFTKYSIEEWLL